MIDRRQFPASLEPHCLAAPRAVEAQQAGTPGRIGYLDQGSATRNAPYLQAFRQGLRDLGWVEGQNIVIEARFAEGKADQLPMLAAEALGLTVPPSVLLRADHTIE
jgi:putative ABC transport system substrate-binding protein